MSYVTGVVLITSCSEDPAVITALGAWVLAQPYGCSAYGAPVFTDVADRAVGHHPELCIWTAGLNYLPDKEFLYELGRADWQDPDNLIVVLSRPNCNALVFRHDELEEAARVCR